MIAQAYEPVTNCTCHLDFTEYDNPPCPVHGITYGPVYRSWPDVAVSEKAPANSTAGFPAPTPLAEEAHSAEYIRGRAAGFREGIEAAMKLMGTA